jgi:hypothetical protein
MMHIWLVPFEAALSGCWYRKGRAETDVGYMSVQ